MLATEKLSLIKLAFRRSLPQLHHPSKKRALFENEEDDYSAGSGGASRDPSRSPQPPRRPPPPPVSRPHLDDAEAAERDAGIRVSAPPPPEEEIVPQEPEPEIGDLLNLGGAPPAPGPTATRPPPPAHNFNPFANFEDPAPPPPPTQPPKQNLDDLFSGLNTEDQGAAPGASTPSGPDLLQNWNASNLVAPPASMPRNLSSPAVSATAPSPAPDPFAEFLSSNPNQFNQAPGGVGARTASPVVDRSASPAMGPAASPAHHRPNYSRSAFADLAGPKAGATGVKPKVSGMEFDDLLSSSGFAKSQSSAGPQTIAEMVRKEEAKTTDPEVLKIRDWTKGKERNIRALLGTLHEITWEGNKWTQVSMGELLSPVQIKKHYRKACLAVHPDKLQGTPHESFAKLIFTELNDAYTEYVNQGEPSF